MLICITFLELISVQIWTVYLYRKCVSCGGRIRKTAVLIALLVFAFILGGQLASLFAVGHYVDVLTLSNIYSYKDVGWKIILSSSLVVLICLSMTLFFAGTTAKGWYRKIQWPVALYSLFFCCINPQGAMLNFGHAYYSYLNQSMFSPDAKLRRVQQQLYGQNTTFDNNFDVQKVLDLRNKNIIIVFAEGFSFQLIDKFNHHKNLTPNLDSFLDESAYFDNYFNHTAATFRGLRGQLTSSYQYKGGFYPTNDGYGQISGEKIKQILAGNLVSIPHILSEKGFHSYFLSAHPNQHRLNLMLETLEFNKVYGADDFRAEHSDKNLTDQQLFSDLSVLVNNNTLHKPYLLGVYNIGTHVGQDSPDLKYGDGKNVLLNTVHNFDYAFGRFWNSVKVKSDIVVILTADHSTPVSDLYSQTFGKPRSPYGIDMIPFVIWSTNVKHAVINANGRNSLDLAPTLMQAMGFKHAFNYFLGCSLFSSECPRKFEHISGGGDFFIEVPSIRVLDAKNTDDQDILQKIKDFYNLSEDRRFL